MRNPIGKLAAGSMMAGLALLVTACGGGEEANNMADNGLGNAEFGNLGDPSAVEMLGNGTDAGNGGMGNDTGAGNSGAAGTNGAMGNSGTDSGTDAGGTNAGGDTGGNAAGGSANRM